MKILLSIGFVEIEIRKQGSNVLVVQLQHVLVIPKVDAEKVCKAIMEEAAK